jgi:hypothetical protein
MDMGYGMWNKRSLHKEGLLTVVSKELSKYKLDLVGVQEVSWDRGATEPAGKYIYFFMETGMKTMNWVNVSLCIREIVVVPSFRAAGCDNDLYQLVAKVMVRLAVGK